MNLTDMEKKIGDRYVNGQSTINKFIFKFFALLLFLLLEKELIDSLDIDLLFQELN